MISNMCIATHPSNFRSYCDLALQFWTWSSATKALATTSLAAAIGSDGVATAASWRSWRRHNSCWRREGVFGDRPYPLSYHSYNSWITLASRILYQLWHLRQRLHRRLQRKHGNGRICYGIGGSGYWGGYDGKSVSFVGNWSNPVCYDFKILNINPNLQNFIPISATVSATVATQIFTIAKV